MSDFITSDDKLIWIFSLLIGSVLIFGLIGSANAELYKYPLPSDISVKQGESFTLVNLSNSTVSVNERNGLFGSLLSVNGTWTHNMHDKGNFEWIDTDGNIGVIRVVSPINNNLSIASDPIINVSDNVVYGTATPETPIAVTVINPNMDSSTVIVKTDEQGNFEQKLNPTSNGNHDIYVTDKNKTTATSYNVEDKDKNLDTRLSILKVLESILKIIYGSE